MTITSIPTPPRARAHVSWPELYVCGDVSLLEKPAVAIVGTRNPSPHAYELVWQYAEHFANCDVCVVSGNAEGVDKTAEYATLRHMGSIISVLPDGIRDSIVREMSTDKFLVISPFPPGTQWSVANAMARVRLIVALASAVIAVEPNPDGTGGTNETIRVARELGRECFVIPRAETLVNITKSQLLF